ncbi:MAG: glycosyltransferase [Planctomycetota bacterium]|nr:glycosyltransferase [Planctomycetota bacterium]
MAGKTGTTGTIENQAAGERPLNSDEMGRFPLDLSLVAPAHNEQDNIHALVSEVERVFTLLRESRGLVCEFIVVDDGSTDSTRGRVLELAATRPWLRCVAMTRTPPGRGNGQSAAFKAGFAATRGKLVAVLDADLQNDPADLPAMLDLLARDHADFVQGDRSHNRRDTLVRRYGSIVGRVFRRALLGDTIRDTGCSLRLMRREIAVQLPLEFRGMHRFIPVMARHMGAKVVEMPVRHRPRAAGETKYGSGLRRALPGLVDCFAVRYMRDRRRPTASVEVHAEESRVPGQSSPVEGVHPATNESLNPAGVNS